MAAAQRQTDTASTRPCPVRLSGPRSCRHACHGGPRWSRTMYPSRACRCVGLAGRAGVSCQPRLSAAGELQVTPDHAAAAAAAGVVSTADACGGAESPGRPLAAPTPHVSHAPAQYPCSPRRPRLLPPTVDLAPCCLLAFGLADPPAQGLPVPNPVRRLPPPHRPPVPVSPKQLLPTQWPRCCLIGTLGLQHLGAGPPQSQNMSLTQPAPPVCPQHLRVSIQ